MPPHQEPKYIADISEPETDAIDSGWDPYITSLLRGTEGPQNADADETAPVMSFSQKPAKPGRR